MPVAADAPAGTIGADSWKDLKKQERLRLKAWEPQGHVSARAERRGNYEALDYVGEVEEVLTNERIPTLRVRWHLPAVWGYDTTRGTVSTLIHIANGVWLETRKRPRNVVATIERITEEEYQELLRKALAM